MTGATYLKGGVIADVGTEHELTASTASEFVSNGRAVYVDARHTDVAPPRGAEPDKESDDSTLSLKGKRFA
jgi:hypothetical protein